MKYFFTLIILLSGTCIFAQTAPNFTVTTSDGDVRNLYNDYLNQGKVVVIEAFFTTCPPCNTHAPYWQALYQSQLIAHPNKVEFIMLSTLQSDNNTKVGIYRNNKGLTMPGVGNDGGGLAAILPYMNGQFGEFQGTPTFIVIDTDGHVTFDIRGTSPQNTMDLIAQQITTDLAQFCSIQTPFGTPLADVQISATSSNMTANITASSTYSLSSISQLQNTSYTISATKTDDNPLSGVTTFDLVKISKHILGLEILNEPWQLAAADMNCNGTITTFDIVIGRKLILGIDNEFPCSTWRFISNGSNQASNGGCVDLVGVRLGDITGPYFAPPASERAPLVLESIDREVKAGETVFIPLYASENVSARSLQMGMNIDQNALQINQLGSLQLPGFDAATCANLNAVTMGRLPVLWIDDTVAEIDRNVPVLTIQATALQNGLLSDMIHLDPSVLASEIFDTDARPVSLDLQWRDQGIETTHAWQVFPNPARSSFYLNYASEEKENGLIQVVDCQGKIVLEQTVSLEKGENQWALQVKNNASGLHAIKLNGRPLGSILLGF